MMLKRGLLLFTMLLFVACGEFTTSPPQKSNQPSEPTHTQEPTQAEQNRTVSVTLSGKITYDSVPFKSGLDSGLDYNNITKKPVRGAEVQIIDRAGKILKKTATDKNGHYSVTVTSKQVKVRVLTKLYRAKHAGKSSWDFQVKDNTNSNALYAMDGRLVNLGDKSTQTRNLNASSGWDGNGYSAKRVAAPFAILDVIYKAINMVTEAQSDAVFPPLNVFWSKNNIASDGQRSLGQIITSHYDGTALYILGKANSDTDEYDSVIIGHEWGHYYESAFSRADNIGGAHAIGDMLDIRVAFGEGFGTAMGGIINKTPFYRDSYGQQQHQSFGADLEKKNLHNNHLGWFNESSIYHILYDIYDEHDDGADTLSLGFKAIHEVLVNEEKNTPAFTSIFTFITALKAHNPDDISKIDKITKNENIQPIHDIYGTGRANREFENANPLYAHLSVGSSVNVHTNYSATSTSPFNTLGRYNFIIFTISASGTYTLNVQQLYGSNLDPDIFLYKEGSKTVIAQAEEPGSEETLQLQLSKGTYRIELNVYDGANLSTKSATFKFNLN